MNKIYLLLCLVLLLTTVFSTNWDDVVNGKDLIDNCPSNVIKEFHGLRYVNSNNIDDCNTFGSSSWVDFNFFDGSHIRPLSISSNGSFFITVTTTSNNLIFYFTNVDWNDLDVECFYQLPYTVYTEFDEQNIADYNDYGTISLINSTYLLVNNTFSGNNYEVQYGNSTYNSTFIGFGNYGQLTCEEIPRTNLITNNTYPTPTFRPAVSIGDLHYTFSQYMFTDDANTYAHVGFIEGMANPKVNFIVDTPDTFALYNYNTFDGLCSAYIIGNEELLYPSLTYSPYQPSDADGSGFVMASWYNVDYDYIYLWNNTATYILDSYYNIWWFIPPFECEDIDTPITISALRLTEGGSDSEIGTEWSLPIIPKYATCVMLNSTNYTIDSSLSSSAVNTVYITWINGTNTTISSYSETTADFSYIVETIDYTNLSQISYMVGDNEICRYESETTNILGLSTLDVPDGYDWILFTVLISVIAVSLINPYFIMFGLVWNDLFSLINPMLMGGMVILVGFVSSIISWSPTGTSFSMKSFTFFAVFGVLFIIYAFTQTGAGIDTSSFNGFDNLFEQYGKLTDTLSNPNPASMIVGGVSFILVLIEFFIFAPAYFVQFIVAVLMEISSPIGTALNFFSPVIILGIYATIIAKGYELLSNRYLEV